MAASCFSPCVAFTFSWSHCRTPTHHRQRLLSSSSSRIRVHDAAILRLPAVAYGASRRKGRQSTKPIAMALPLDIVTTTAALAATGVLGFGVLRTIVYFRMQYIIAAMLGRHVPRGGARVMDLGIREGRNLYYYPKDTVQVVVVTPKPNVQLLESQAVNAGVPIKIFSKASDVSGLPPNSMDAVVSVYGMAEMTDEQVTSALREAVRVLKPGKALIYVENVGAEGGVVRAAQVVLERSRNLAGGQFRVARDVLRFLEDTEGLQDFKYERVLEFQDPHLVGIATKKPTVSTATGIGKDKIPRKTKKGRS